MPQFRHRHKGPEGVNFHEPDIKSSVFSQDYAQYSALQHGLSKVICGADIPYPNI